MYFMHLNLNLFGDCEIWNMWTLKIFNYLFSDLFCLKLFTLLMGYVLPETLAIAIRYLFNQNVI